MADSIISTAALRDVDPLKRILAGILNRARLDAEGGSLEALAWLVTDGIDVCEYISHGSSYVIQLFVREQWELWGACAEEATRPRWSSI